MTYYDLWLIILFIFAVPCSFIAPATLEMIEDKWRAYKGYPPFRRAK